MKQGSFLSAKCSVRRSEISGIGVFAKKTISKGELIAAWGGFICNKKEMARRAKKRPELMMHPISIFDDLFLVPFKYNSLEKSDRFNHSCEPNAGVKGQILLIARKNILPGEEIVFDYETTEIGRSDGLPFTCKCKGRHCRKRITGNAWKDKKFRKENRGFFSWYIENKIQKEI
jgi:SET domain-containing protein